MENDVDAGENISEGNDMYGAHAQSLHLGGNVEKPDYMIAEKLQEHGYEILWLGTRGRMEEMLVPKHGFNIEYIDVKGIRRNGLKAKITAPFMLVRSILEALAVLRKFRPGVCIGMGGYASGPGGVEPGAGLLGRRLVCLPGGGGIKL